jgi:hypothetical protein
MSVLNQKMSDRALDFARQLEEALPKLDLTDDASGLPDEIREAVNASRVRPDFFVTHQ